MSGVIRARGLGKMYRRYPAQWKRLAEWCTLGAYQSHLELWALKGISFDIEAGEAVGIVGQNGAGKSTLLKLIVGTTVATEGTFEVTGDVAALLELGMGFHPEFSGEQNAMMALQMTGLSEEGARALLPDVADFSELGEFLAQPFRTYSSGMQMRLAFAVATVRRPHVLIVDEALSVGDAYFQHKCIRRIRTFKELGTTMLFVSHDPAAVKTLCDRALLLDSGELVQEGSAESVLDYYNALIAQREKDASIEQKRLEKARFQTRSGDSAMKISGVDMVDADSRSVRSFTTGESATIICEMTFSEPLEEYTVGIMIRDRLGNEVFGTNTMYLDLETPKRRPGETLVVRFSLKLELGYGPYSLTVAAHSPLGHVERTHDWIDNALNFHVVPKNAERFAGVANLSVAAELDAG